MNLALLATLVPKDLLNGLFLALGLIGIDFLMGVIVAIKNRTFDWQLLPKFLGTHVLPEVGGLIVLAAGSGIPAIRAAFLTTLAAVTASYVASINDKRIALFGVVPGPVPPPPTPPRS